MLRKRPTGGPRQISEDDQRLRQRLDALAWLLDNSIRLPGGFRIGLDALIGLVPFLGDAAGVFLSGYIVRQAANLGAPPSVLVRMVANVAVEGIIGLIPFAGDLFDAAWKANMRNVQLLSRHLENPTATVRSSRRFVALLLIVLLIFMVGLALVSALLMRWAWGLVSS